MKTFLLTTLVDFLIFILVIKDNKYFKIKFVSKFFYYENYTRIIL